MPWVGICQQTPFLLQEGGKDNKCCSAKKEEVFFAFRHLNNELDCLVGVVAEESILLLVCLIPASCTEGVCLLLKSFPVRCHLVPFPGHKYRTDCKAVDPGCHWVQSHWGGKKINLSKGSVWISGLFEFHPSCPAFWSKWRAFEVDVFAPNSPVLAYKTGVEMEAAEGRSQQAFSSIVVQ